VVTRFSDPRAHRVVAREIRAARLRARLTRAQLAKRLSCSHAVIVAIEQGKRRITVGDLVRIAQALAIDPVRLLRKCSVERRG
jgi:transcriptional regulator with XRE-family HTH domain